MMNDEIISIKRFFESHQIVLSDEWLESCITWCKEENLGPSYSIKDLQLKVYEQWLLLDLRDAEVPSLPPNLSQHKKFILNGTFSLQIMQIVDISKPKLWQLQKIRNSNALTKNTEHDKDGAGTGKRVLQLTLTDGVQCIEAIEYRPISSLNINLTPGIKVRLIGPITVRRGRIMLEDQNIKVLGGEVEDIIVGNAAENVLAKALNLPLNPQPNVIEENLLKANMDLFNTNEGNTSSNAQHFKNTSKTTQQNPYLQNIMPQSRLSSYNEANDILINKAIKTTDTSHEFDEVESRIDEEMEMLLEAERDLERNNGQISNQTSKTPDLFEDIDFDCDFDNFETPMKTHNKKKIMSSKSEHFENRANNKISAFDNNKPTTSTTMLDDFKFDKNRSKNENIDSGRNSTQKVQEQEHMSDDDVFGDIDIDSHLDEIEKKMQSPEIQKQNNNHMWTIEKLLKNKSFISKGVFKVKVKFKSIVEKLTIDDNQFKLVITITDDTGEITVNVHSDVISEFAGHCPSAIMSLKSGIMDKDETAAGRVIKAIQNVKEKLVKLDTIVDIQINRNESLPTIIKVF